MHPDLIGAVLLAVAIVLLALIALVFSENYHS